VKQFIASKILITLCLLAAARQPQAQNLTDSALVEALKDGGHVLVMRHTSSPRELPDAATVNPDNVNGERQLDEKGRRDATAIGEALRRLQIPVGQVLSSPAYRALETARLAGFDEVTVQQELGNDDMEASTAQNAEWLRVQAANAPQQGNLLLITHGPNLNAAFAQAAAGMEEGDMLVLNPRSRPGPEVVGIIKSSHWLAL
jgi:phosphohistidine phosphatase SixA